MLLIQIINKVSWFLRAWLASCRFKVALIGAIVLLSACSGASETGNSGTDLPLTGRLDLPVLVPAELNGGRLRVVATTSIIGDVVGRIGGEAIDLTVLMKPSQDPHSYVPTADDLSAAARAHVIFVNGWNLEEGLVDDLANVAGESMLVPISANIEPLSFGGIHSADQPAGGEQGMDPDPHVWLDPHNVRQWADNAGQVLGKLDPENEALYRANTTAYQKELSQLVATYDEQVSLLAPEQRKLVTSHDAFAYFASAYDFEVIGTVIPGASTLAEPSAKDIAALVNAMKKQGVCALFAETTANDQLARTVASELDTCETVQILNLYTGALDVDSGADSYIKMMQSNIETIVEGLK